MTKFEIVKSGTDYIEQNLKAEVTAAELAHIAGYSVWHYCRLFSEVTGTSVSAYIQRRLLDRALAEISGGRTALDAVLDYGFDTYAGFYKAFVKMYGCSPKKYLAIYHKHTPQKTEVKLMYSQAELRKILGNWDEAKSLPIAGTQVIDGTRASDRVWQIGGGYFLKTGERSQLIKSIAIANALHSRGLAASTPVATRSGEEFLDGENIFVLTTKIPGNPLEKSERFGEKRGEYGEKYGKAIAKRHIALREIEDEVLTDEVDLFAHVKEWALPNVKKQNEQWSLDLPDSYFTDYTETFGKLSHKLPKRLIHRDPNPSNILFENGEVTGFIDFDLSERNVRLWDICYCATGILSEWRGVENNYEKWPEILHGILRGARKGFWARRSFDSAGGCWLCNSPRRN
ncbi:MAG: helix-turn-helix domain-containing protein [Oscillospiraceae bacterium]|nr:helix-turn-helix domain-containing protein [Oscillospiraceae bacterium]